MLHHLAGATIQVASLVNFNCHPEQDGNKGMAKDFPQYNVMQGISSYMRLKSSLKGPCWRGNKFPTIRCNAGN